MGKTRKVTNLGAIEAHSTLILRRTHTSYPHPRGRNHPYQSRTDASVDRIRISMAHQKQNSRPTACQTSPRFSSDINSDHRTRSATILVTLTQSTRDPSMQPFYPLMLSAIDLHLSSVADPKFHGDLRRQKKEPQGCSISQSTITILALEGTGQPH